MSITCGGVRASCAAVVHSTSTATRELAALSLAKASFTSLIVSPLMLTSTSPTYRTPHLAARALGAKSVTCTPVPPAYASHPMPRFAEGLGFVISTSSSSRSSPPESPLLARPVSAATGGAGRAGRRTVRVFLPRAPAALPAIMCK